MVECCAHKLHEEGVWIEDGASKFWVVLNPDEPGVVFQFNNFDKTGIRIDAYSFHTGGFHLLEVFIIKFIPVSVAFLNVGLTIGAVRFCTFLETTVV